MSTDKAYTQPIPDLSPKDIDRFWSKVRKTSTCWLWTDPPNAGGYGLFYVRTEHGHRNLRAHRIAFVLAGGDLPSGLVVDHICRNRTCVNPEHLRAVTPRENTLVGLSPTADNARKTHCIRGHEFTPENTAIARGERDCLICRSARQKLRDSRLRTCPHCGKKSAPSNFPRHLRLVHGAPTPTEETDHG